MTRIEIELKGIVQDGPDFYLDPDDNPHIPLDELPRIASYPELVKSDRDLEGALKARERFAKEYPQYRA